MTKGSFQLQRFRAERRNGATMERAAEAAGIGLAEARLIVAEDGEPERRRVTVSQGDCVEVLRTRTGPLFDAVVTDPPYHLLSTVERFAKVPRTESTMPKSDAHARMSRGFMGQTWDGGDVAFRVETWRAIYDQMKPGAHLIAFSGTRTYHRMAVAIEDAGFEIRDQLAWVYGSGFPKSHNVERAAGADWQGWGTALKPAWEPICLARKPLIGTVAANVLAHGTGGLNIDDCRVGMSEADRKTINAATFRNSPASVALGRYASENSDKPMAAHDAGRWPANLLHDGSEEVEALFPHSDGQQGDLSGHSRDRVSTGIFGDMSAARDFPARGDSGSAARFFYSAKAGPLDRLGSEHPTVKPVDVMRWLVRLITPPGGLILDPFARSGTTGIAAMAEGFGAELIDLEAAHVADIERKLASLRGEGARVMEQHIRRKAERSKRAPSPLFGDDA